MVSAKQRSSSSPESLRSYDPGAIDEFSAFMSTEEIQEQLGLPSIASARSIIRWPISGSNVR